MITEKTFFIEILNLLPNNSVLYIQAPDLNSIKISNILKETEFPYYQSIHLNDENRMQIIDSVLTEDVLGYIHSAEIRFKSKLLFEGYDGMEFGTISKEIVLSEKFKNSYIEGDMCTISTEW